MEFSPQKRIETSVLDDLYFVGKNKPLGYLPLETILESGVTLEKIKSDLEAKGLNVFALTEEDCEVASGALYAYDAEALQNILNNNVDVLIQNAVPKTALDFILWVAKFEAAPGTELFSLIAEAFGKK